MTMKSYTLYDNGVVIFLTNAKTLTVYFTRDSGKIYYRYKIDSISNVKHPGIFLGVDVDGTRYFLHNHFETGPSIDSELNFSKGRELFLNEEQPINPLRKVIELGLNQIIEGKAYNWYDYNCQVYINLAANNHSRSESVDKWVGGIFIFGLALLGIKAFNN